MSISHDDDRGWVVVMVVVMIVGVVAAVVE
jgi:hypothetical protein